MVKFSVYLNRRVFVMTGTTTKENTVDKELNGRIDAEQSPYTHTTCTKSIYERTSNNTTHMIGQDAVSDQDLHCLSLIQMQNGLVLSVFVPHLSVS